MTVLPGRRRVAVYRQVFLPRSETFVRDHLVRMPRWDTVAVTSHLLDDALPVPGKEPQSARARSLAPRAQAAVLRRVRRPDRADALALADTLRRIGADVVHAHFGTDGAVALEPTRRAGLPLVVTFHGYDVSSYDHVLRQSPGGSFMLDHWEELMDRAAALVTVSEFLKVLLVDRGAPAEKVHVIPCGVDVESFRSSDPDPDGGLLFVGRLVEKKGLADAIDALAGMDNAPRLTVIGDGPLRTELQERAAANGVSCEFLGVRTTDEIRAAMRACSAVVMPSRRAATGDCEGLPVTALEAGASGRAVVGYAHSGIAEAVLHEQTGLLAPEGDVTALRELLERVVSDEEERRDLGWQPVVVSSRTTGSRTS